MYQAAKSSKKVTVQYAPATTARKTNDFQLVLMHGKTKTRNHTLPHLCGMLRDKRGLLQELLLFHEFIQLTAESLSSSQLTKPHNVSQHLA